MIYKYISFAEIGEEKELFYTNKKFKNEEEFSDYLKILKNPYYITEGEQIYLNDDDEKYRFYNNSNLRIIYSTEDNIDLYPEYKLIYEDYSKTNDVLAKVTYPQPIDHIFFGLNFFLGINDIVLPPFNPIRRDIHNLFHGFWKYKSGKIFHLFARKKCGTTMYIMKQMCRVSEYKIYIDIRKLSQILHSKNETNKIYDIKKYIIYSMFYLVPFIDNDNFGYNEIKKYYKEIFNLVYEKKTFQKLDTFIKKLMNAYITIYNKYVLELLNQEEYQKSQFMIITIDHFNDDFDLSFIFELIKEKKIKLLVVHSINSPKALEKLFSYLDDIDNYRPKDLGSAEGIELSKDNIFIGYYSLMTKIEKSCLNGEYYKYLRLYEQDLEENFNSYNIYYYIEFLKYLNKIHFNNEEKDPIIFKKFIKKICLNIEDDISKFYNYEISHEFFYLSNYQKISSSFEDDENYEKINSIKKNIPLDYFKMEPYNKNLKKIKIEPAFNLIRNIIKKKAQYSDCVVYQSKFYDNTINQGEKGNILQRAIEERIQIEPSILLNYLEKTLIFKIECIIPSATVKADPVKKFYNNFLKTGNDDITSYMDENEIKEMKELSKIIENSKMEEQYQNIVLIETKTNAKNYDMAIIKFIDDKYYILILFQITVSREKKKFTQINCGFDKDIKYITSKLENSLKGYLSQSVHLIYVLDLQKDEMNIDTLKVDIKNQIPKELLNNVHLLFFGRQFLNFFNEDKKMVKELLFEKNNLKFEITDSEQYFVVPFYQKAFDKVLNLFKIKVGEFYINNYDFEEISGNFLIFSKINNQHLVFIVNLNNKICHSLEIKNSIIYNNKIEIKEKKKAYFFKIKNPNEVNPISIFNEVALD